MRLPVRPFASSTPSGSSSFDPCWRVPPAAINALHDQIDVGFPRIGGGVRAMFSESFLVRVADDRKLLGAPASVGACASLSLVCMGNPLFLAEGDAWMFRLAHREFSISCKPHRFGIFFGGEHAFGNQQQRKAALVRSR